VAAFGHIDRRTEFTSRRAEFSEVAVTFGCLPETTLNATYFLMVPLILTHGCRWNCARIESLPTDPDLPGPRS